MQLTELKLALFNDDSGIKRDIEIEARNPRVNEEDRLKVDMASGTEELVGKCQS